MKKWVIELQSGYYKSRGGPDNWVRDLELAALYFDELAAEEDLSKVRKWRAARVLPVNVTVTPFGDPVEEEQRNAKNCTGA